MTNNKIQGYAERIENVLNEIDALKGDIKDLYEEVKSADIKPKVLRKAIANKRRKTDAQFEAEVEEYAAALLAMPGATYRSVAEQTGISKSKLQRRVPREANGTAHHDPETGEIETGGQDVASQDSESCPAPTAPLPLPSPEREARPGSILPSSAPVAASGKEVRSEHTPELSSAAGAGPFGSQDTGGDHVARSELLTIDRQNDIDDDAPAGALKAGSNSTGESHDGRLIAEPEVARVAPPAVASPIAVGVDPRPKGTPIPDDLTIPAHLDQRKRQVHA